VALLDRGFALPHNTMEAANPRHKTLFRPSRGNPALVRQLQTHMQHRLKGYQTRKKEITPFQMIPKKTVAFNSWALSVCALVFND
jgi:hypothetical protein